MRIVYRDSIIRVESFSDRLEKRRRTRIVEKDVVIVLAFLDADTLLLEKHYRASIGRWIFELPAGHIEAKETPKTAAKRELREETGYIANRIRLL